MKVEGKPFRAIWVKQGNEKIVQIIDQRHLPHRFVIEDLSTLEEAETAIKEMHVRGAPLIGATAAYGMYLASLQAPKNNFEGFIQQAGAKLKASRPTAVNLAFGVEKQLLAIKKWHSPEEKIAIAFKTAAEITENEVENGRKIGQHGLKIIKAIAKKKNGRAVINIMTHCNAGWLATVDYGTATAPIYAAFEKGIKLHVWVSETRPWNQGARLTAWEMQEQGVPYTVIADNAAGHLMQHGFVDMVIVGADRVTRTGDAANKIGTYLKAVAAKDNNVPFYVALPSSTFDWRMRNGVKEIPIEERGSEEVKYIQGLCNGEIKKVLLTPEKSNAVNYAFDVTPARLITGLITERGVCRASEKGILSLFPEKK